MTDGETNGALVGNDIYGICLYVKILLQLDKEVKDKGYFVGLRLVLSICNLPSKNILQISIYIEQ